MTDVWSGGLGNPHSNALPRCQLLKIQSIATSICEDLNGNIPVWMDTLTVPHTKAERTIAINRMRETYQNTDRVLTFVQDFEDVDKGMKPLEFFVRLACCSWMRRLWTLQEGVLAKKLYF